MGSLRDRLANSVIVEYDAPGGRRKKEFTEAHRSKRFFLNKEKAGKNPKIIKGRSMMNGKVIEDEQPPKPKPKGAKHLAVYMRVSADDQTNASQQHDIQRWLDGHGTENVITYYDHGESSETLDRSDFPKLEKAIFNGEVDTVVVWALDRISRDDDILVGMTLLAKWLKAGVRVVSLKEQFDFSGEWGMVIAALLFKFASLDKTRRRQRQRAGIEAAKAANGGKCPWGGSKKGRRQRKTRVKNDAVVTLYNQQGDTKNIKAIAQAVGVTRETVYRILRDNGLHLTKS